MGNIRNLNYGGSGRIKIGLTPPLVFEILQANTVPLPIPVLVDCSLKALRFIVKENKEDVNMLILKQNTLGGGGDSQILVSSGSVQIGILNTDTQFLSFDGEFNKYYWELKNITDEVTIAWGFIILIRTSQADAGSFIPPSPSAPQLIFDIVDANQPITANALVIKANTYNAVLTFSYTDVGKYLIISDQPIFVDANVIQWYLLLRNDTDSFEVKITTIDAYHLSYEITAFAGGGFIDHDIRTIIFNPIALVVGSATALSGVLRGGIGYFADRPIPPPSVPYFWYAIDSDRQSIYFSGGGEYT